MILAFGAGVGTVALLEAQDGSVRTRGDLERMLEVAPLAILPLIETRAERARRRRRNRMALVGSFGAFVLALVLTHLFYRPLDVLWTVALRKWGA
jgi:protein tyrosine kinase modulator